MWFLITVPSHVHEKLSNLEVEFGNFLVIKKDIKTLLSEMDRLTWKIGKNIGSLNN